MSDPTTPMKYLKGTGHRFHDMLAEATEAFKKETQEVYGIPDPLTVEDRFIEVEEDGETLRFRKETVHLPSCEKFTLWILQL